MSPVEDVPSHHFAVTLGAPACFRVHSEPPKKESSSIPQPIRRRNRHTAGVRHCNAIAVEELALHHELRVC
jgi:hypothetical protein